MSSIKKLDLKPISKTLITEFGNDGVVLKATHSYQLISAAFGLWAHELTQKYDIPFDTYGHETFPGAQPQFNERFLIERVTQLCQLDEWKAQHMTQVVLDVLKRAKLRINGIKILFISANEDHRISIFKALKNPIFPPIHASVAIANGDLPPIPATNLRDRVQMVGPKNMMGGTLHNLVARAKSYLWIFPPADLKEAAYAYADRIITEGPQPTAELGLGFCVVQPFKLSADEAQRYTIITPILDYRKNRRSPWDVTMLSSSKLESLTPRPWFSDIMERGDDNIYELKVCPNCLALYSDDLPELKRSCSCIGSDVADIHTILNDWRAAGRFEITTIQMLECLKGEYQVNRDTPVNESKNAAFGRFLRKNEATFGIRHLTEESAKDKNGRKTTTAKWIIGRKPIQVLLS
ncbi:hypothetical protein [Methylobacter tundripaludum]|nr:hypothetical protein [Methylobacter tundripaludum]